MSNFSKQIFGASAIVGFSLMATTLSTNVAHAGQTCSQSNTDTWTVTNKAHGRTGPTTVDGISVDPTGGAGVVLKRNQKVTNAGDKFQGPKALGVGNNSWDKDLRANNEQGYLIKMVDGASDPSKIRLEFSDVQKGERVKVAGQTYSFGNTKNGFAALDVSWAQSVSVVVANGSELALHKVREYEKSCQTTHESSDNDDPDPEPTKDTNTTGGPNGTPSVGL